MKTNLVAKTLMLYKCRSVSKINFYGNDCEFLKNLNQYFENLKEIDVTNLTVNVQNNSNYNNINLTATVIEKIILISEYMDVFMNSQKLPSTLLEVYLYYHNEDNVTVSQLYSDHSSTFSSFNNTSAKCYIMTVFTVRSYIGRPMLGGYGGSANLGEIDTKYYDDWFIDRYNYVFGFELSIYTSEYSEGVGYTGYPLYVDFAEYNYKAQQVYVRSHCSYTATLVNFSGSSGNGHNTHIEYFKYDSDFEAIIKQDCFNHCSPLREVELCDNIVAFGGWSFNRCTSLEKLNIPKKIRYIGRYAITKTLLTNFCQLPSVCFFVGDHAFEETQYDGYYIPPMSNADAQAFYSGDWGALYVFMCSQNINYVDMNTKKEYRVL